MTTTTITTLVWRAATPTENYNWTKKISDAFTAVGFLKTADTGQIALTGTTIALPTSLDSTYKEFGYEIRSLTSAGKPTIYFRIGYGVANGGVGGSGAAQNYPVLRVQMGTASDGAGGLPGVRVGAVMSNEGIYTSAENPSLAQRAAYIASDGQNYLTISIDPTLSASLSPVNASPVLQAGWERTIDPVTGVFDGEGAIVISGSTIAVPSSGSPTETAGRANINFGYINFSSSLTNWNAVLIPSQAPTLFTSSGIPGVTPLFPITVMLPRIKGPCLMALAYWTADMLPGTVFQTTVYGATRTYISGGTGTGMNAIQPSPSALRLALRFD